MAKATKESAKVGATEAAKKPSPRTRAHVLYHRDGSVWARGRMAGDMMAGHWKWYRTDGTIMRSGSFENGEPAGEWTTHDSQGKVVKVTNKSKRPRGTGATRPAPVGPGSRTERSRTPIHADILAYNAVQSGRDKRICDALAKAIDRRLPNAESKIWHRHPVWFLDGNPIVGYHRLKDCVRLLFWSGRSFDEPGLASEGGFQTAGARYTAENQISAKDLKRWLEKSIAIQWDYKNIVKRKGRLARLK